MSKLIVSVPNVSESVKRELSSLLNTSVLQIPESKDSIEIEVPDDANVNSLGDLLQTITYFLNLPSPDFLEFLIVNGLHADKALSLILLTSTKHLDLKKTLIEIALKNGAKNTNELLRKAVDDNSIELADLAIMYNAEPNSINYFSWLPSLDFLEFLISKGLDADNALQFIMNVSTKKYNFEIGLWGMVNQDLVDLQKSLIEVLLREGAQINSINYFSSLPSSDSLEFLINNGLEANKALQLILKKNPNLGNNKLELNELIELTIKSGANPLYKRDGDRFTILDKTVLEGDLDIIDTLLENVDRDKVTLSTLCYGHAIAQLKFSHRL